MITKNFSSPALLALLFVLNGGCQTAEERKKEEARLDSLRRDSARPVINPYTVGQGTSLYDRERKNLGNLDSLVTPAQPPLPSR